MKKVMIFVFILISAADSFAQNDTLRQDYSFKRHSVYAELLGSSINYSLNYDYLFGIHEDNIKFAAGVGTGFSILPPFYLGVYLIPEANFLFGKKSHFLETGAALMISSVFNKYDYVTLIPSARIGYRYQPRKGGFLFRIGYTPFLMGDEIFYIYGGVSFGYVF